MPAVLLQSIYKSIPLAYGCSAFHNSNNAQQHSVFEQVAHVCAHLAVIAILLFVAMFASRHKPSCLG